MKCPVSRQLKQTLALLLLVVTWLALLCGAFMVFWLLNCVLGACHLGLSPILHWGLRSWCSVAEASWFLKAILLAGLAFQKLTLVILPFFSFGPFCKDSLVHQSIEVRVDLRSRQGLEFWV